MIRQTVLVLLALLSGCAHAIVEPPPPLEPVSIYDGVPEWVQVGSGVDRTGSRRWFSGVGRASLKDQESQAVAETRARGEVAKIVGKFLFDAAIGRPCDCGSEDSSKSKELADLAQALRDFERVREAETQIVDRWTSRDGTEVFVLARQDADSLITEWYASPGLSDRTREIIKAQADSTFTLFEKDEARRVTTQ